MSDELAKLTEAGTVEIDWNRLLRTPTYELDDEELAAAGSLINVAKAALEDREKALKDKLRNTIQEKGTPISDKTIKWDAGEVTVSATVSETVKVNEAELRKAMQANGIEESELYDRVLTLSDSKLERAIVQGRFTDEQVAGFTNRTKKTPVIRFNKHLFGLSKKQLLADG